MNTNSSLQSKTTFDIINLRIIFSIFASGAIVSIVILSFVFQYQNTQKLQVVSIVQLTTFHESLGRDHTSYPSVELNGKPLPRSSGPHSDYSIPFGTYSETQVDEDRAVHSLEHGGIVIYFDEARITNDQKNELERLAKSGSYVVSPYFGLESKIVVLAWTKSLELDELNISLIKVFYKQWLNNSPEQLA